MTARPLIAYDATSAPPQPAGAGRYTLSLARALTELDTAHDYVVYCRSHSLDALAGIASDRVELVDVGRLSRARRYVWEQTSLPRDLRRRRARLLHSPHHSTPLLAPCPRVVTVHDVTFFLIPERYPASRRLFFQAMTFLSVRRARAVVVPSRSAADDLRVVLHPPASKVHVTYEGADEAFRPLYREGCARLAEERYNLPPDYILSVGTLEPGKNRTTLLRALRRLVDDGRDVTLAIVGQSVGWGGSADEALMHELGLQDRVRFTGYVPDADLPALYNAAGVFVFPSLHEGFGLPVLEAMSCGTPVVSSNRSSLPEVLGEAGLLIDPEDQDAIAAAIGRIYDEPTLASLLGQAGVDQASEFSWQKCAEATLQVYRQVLGES